jgi:hypothetical protein
MFFKLKPSCPQRAQVRESPASMIVTEYVCVLDKGHVGAHCSKDGHKWMTYEKIQRRVEQEGTGL